MRKGVLSLHIYQLSKDLSLVFVGCYNEDVLIDLIMHADEVSCFSPSNAGLQGLFDVCSKFADNDRPKCGHVVFSEIDLPRKWTSKP